MSGKTTDTGFNIDGVELQGLDTPENQPGGLIEQLTTFAFDGAEEMFKIARNEGFENDESIPYEMTFPAVLNSIENIRPVLQIKCIGGPNNGKEVIFPCPVGFAVNDGASYNDLELGQFGQSAKNVTQNLLGIEKSGTPISQVFAEAYANDNNSMGSKVGQGIAGALLTGLGLGKEYIPTDALKNVATGIGIALGISVNKNNTTEFTGIGTRSFSFQYKLSNNVKRGLYYRVRLIQHGQKDHILMRCQKKERGGNLFFYLLFFLLSKRILYRRYLIRKRNYREMD